MRMEEEDERRKPNCSLHFTPLGKMQNPSLPPPPLLYNSAILKDSRTSLCATLLTVLFSLVFFFSISSSFHRSSSSSSPLSRPDPFLFPSGRIHATILASSEYLPPSIAYYISGSNGDSARILRLLLATYHPRNHYLLHLDLSASQAERDALALAVQSSPIFRAAQNVNVVGKADFVNHKGSSSVSSALHAASILLRLSSSWDWFVSLHADYYPLVTQDDLLHIFSVLPRDLNFMNVSSYIGWKESRKLKPIIVDPGLYLSEKHAVFYGTQRRELPNAFQLFTGSSFSVLSRQVIEFCVLGTDNLPRTLLMYFSNTPSAHLNYFPTVICNSRQFNRKVINDNLLYPKFETPFREEPRFLNSSDFDLLIRSGAAFATQFKIDDPVLDRIDRELLNRGPGNVVPGGWCLGEAGNDTCEVWGDAEVLRPGPGAGRLERRLVELLSNGKPLHCTVE